MKIVSLASGKGGVGKSNIAANLALALAESGRRVLLFDAALGVANLDLLLGAGGEATVLQAIDGAVPLPDLLRQIAPNLALLPGCSGVSRVERMTQGQRLRLATELRAAALDFDLLLIDTSSGLSDGALFFSATADEVLVISTPETTALSNTYALIKVLATTRQVEAINLLVNRVSDAEQGVQIHARLDGVCRQFLHQSLGYFGAVPRDMALEEAVECQQPLLHLAPDSLASQALRHLAQHFDNIFTAPKRDKISDLWRALIGAPPAAER